MYIDKDDMKLWLKITAAGIGLVLLFTVVIPKWWQINRAFDTHIRRIVGLLFQTGKSFSQEKESNYLADDLKQKQRDFKRRFVTLSSEKEIDLALMSGQSLLEVAPDNKQLLREVAFLFYFTGDYDSAQKLYEKILEDYPKRKRSFKYLKGEDAKAIKRCLLELAALNYETGNVRLMIDFYEQYLSASNRENVYKELVKGGINTKTARFEIFSNMAGGSFLTYLKAIERLEEYGDDFPEDDVFFRLGMLNFDIVNLYAKDDFVQIQEYFYNSRYYFQMVIDTSDEYRSRLIEKNLKKLDEIKQKLELNKVKKD